MDAPSKQCRTCKLPLSFDMFHVNSNRKDGRAIDCKACVSIEQKAKYRRNPEKAKARAAAYERDNPDKVRDRKKKSYQINRVEIRAKAKVRGAANAEKHRADVKRWRLENPERYNKRQREYAMKRAAVDPEYKLMKALRCRIYGFVTGKSKAAPSAELIGCSVEQVRAHLESLWLPGMRWDNHGKGDDKWHIDHIRPCSSFDLTDPDQQRACFHYTNLQPLWQRDNLAKGDTYDPQTGPVTLSPTELASVFRKQAF